MSSLFSDKNALFLLTILEAIEKIKIYSANIKSAEDLISSDDQLQYNAVCHLLLTIGEESKKIEDGLKETQSFVAWDQIAGMRNRIAHDYRGIDKEIVFAIIKDELSILREACENLLKQLHLSDDEMNTLLSSPFYKHLQYLGGK
ncbi:MAG: DUF86 domain-containing protein [Chitinophagaceae bacterium]|nr:DUF86 domain-containing protein [Chitinophagaceae bacterium]